MSIVLAISPHGRPLVIEQPDGGLDNLDASAKRICKAFRESPARGLLTLATSELRTQLTPELAFLRDFAGEYFTQVCHTPEPEGDGFTGFAPPQPERLDALMLAAPPMRGGEYLRSDMLTAWWTELDALVREEAVQTPGGLRSYLREKNPLWRLVGRVTFHLAENKRDEQFPFAFLATYSSRLSAQGRPQHKPLGQALKEYLGVENRPALLSLLTPIQQAAEQSALVRELVESGDVYQPLAWTPTDAFRFLQDIPIFEDSGLLVRVPDWWRAKRPPRPIVSVKLGERKGSVLGADALLDFSVEVVLEDERLSAKELQTLLESTGELIWLKGRWIEIDRQKLNEALQHWKKVEVDAKRGGVSFFEGMRLLSGLTLDSGAAMPATGDAQWTGIVPGKALEAMLRELRELQSAGGVEPVGLHGRLRPYQRAGVEWLRFLAGLGLGACLADDMGLGKTVQVIALLLDVKNRESQKAPALSPSLLVAPASLVANWKAELARFAPSLSSLVVHPSEMPSGATKRPSDSSQIAAAKRSDLVITTYGMLTRVEWLRERTWNLVVLDEAQAVKNANTRQARAVKELKASARIALTGTPIENQLSDLWSLFDFLNPGLLGGAKAFADLVKRLAARDHDRYGPLRKLIQPYILRRLKTDTRVIADLPDKIETNSYCQLTKRQAALYERAVSELAEALKRADGIQRRGIVLSSLMRLKQICNHPAQALSDGDYAPEQSGKFDRLAEICQELAERQQKALIFTQFREITEPLAGHLNRVFGKPGLTLHGQTPVGRRRKMIEAFQRDDGPPFFVLSLKAGGVGLNLTAATHVIHFDRWWNPAVENQATDRAFRIGQKRNVFVYKFVCRGTIEERIDELIASKSALAKDLIEGGAERALTEMNNEQLLQFVSLDVHKALAS
ncbi:MAG: DEAD/DEAH box helicase [Planctomycetia bacterium]|nr:DEAD/DEAH box helicase [Planctomycetia bacterium]